MDHGKWYGKTFVSKMSDIALARADTELGGAWWRGRCNTEGAGELGGTSMSPDNSRQNGVFWVNM